MTPLVPVSTRRDSVALALVREMLSGAQMNAEAFSNRSTSLADVENWFALGTGALLLLVGASRRSTVGALVAAASAPLLYRGITGQWPALANGLIQPDNTRRA